VIALLFIALSASAADLPEGKSRLLVETTCTKCHSAKLLTQQRLTRASWDRVITIMQERNGLWDLEPPARKEILDYFEEHFSPKSVDSMDGLGPRNVNPLP